MFFEFGQKMGRRLNIKNSYHLFWSKVLTKKLCQVWGLSSYPFLRSTLKKKRRTCSFLLEKQVFFCATLYRKLLQLCNYFNNFAIEFFTPFSPQDSFEIEETKKLLPTNMQYSGLTFMHYNNDRASLLRFDSRIWTVGDLQMDARCLLLLATLTANLFSGGSASLSCINGTVAMCDHQPASAKIAEAKFPPSLIYL